MTGMYAIKALALFKQFKDIQALSAVALIKTNPPTRSARISCGSGLQPAADPLYKKSSK